MSLPTHVFGLRRAPLQVQEQRSVRAARGVLQTHHTLTPSFQRLELHYRHIPRTSALPRLMRNCLLIFAQTHVYIIHTYVKHGDPCV